MLLSHDSTHPCSVKRELGSRNVGKDESNQEILQDSDCDPSSLVAYRHLYQRLDVYWIFLRIHPSFPARTFTRMRDTAKSKVRRDVE